MGLPVKKMGSRTVMLLVGALLLASTEGFVRRSMPLQADGQYTYSGFGHMNRGGNDEMDAALDLGDEMDDTINLDATSSEEIDEDCSPACASSKTDELSRCCKCEKKENKYWYSATNRRSNCETVKPLDETKAPAMANAVNEAWNKTHGLEGCKAKLPESDRVRAHLNVTFLGMLQREYEDISGEGWLMKAFTTPSRKENFIDAKIPDPGMYLDDHLVQHRSGLHVVSSRTGSMFLCSS